MDYFTNNGAMLELDYLYTYSDGNCSYDSTKVVANVGPRKTKIDSTEAAHLTALQESPISVCLDASDLFGYGTGVILDNDDTAPCYTSLTHAVVMVGFGTDSTLGDYYLVKNSWGAGWGESGYFRISRA